MRPAGPGADAQPHLLAGARIEPRHGDGACPAAEVGEVVRVVVALDVRRQHGACLLLSDERHERGVSRDLGDGPGRLDPPVA